MAKVMAAICAGAVALACWLAVGSVAAPPVPPPEPRAAIFVSAPATRCEPRILLTTTFALGGWLVERT